MVGLRGKGGWDTEPERHGAGDTMVLIQYLLALAFLVTCAGAGLFRPASIPRLVFRGILVLCSASLVAFFASVAQLRWAATLTSLVTPVVGTLGWVVAITRFRRKGLARADVLRGGSLAAVVLCLAVFPLLAFMGRPAQPTRSSRSRSNCGFRTTTFYQPFLPRRPSQPCTPDR